MTRNLYIGLVALALTGCASVETPPLDDAYYWPDKQTTTVSANAAAPAVQATPNPTLSPTLEFINVKDTVVTVRIKR